MKNLDLDAEFLRVLADVFVVLRQSHRAEDVDLRLAAHVHAGAVHDQNFWHCLLPVDGVADDIPALELQNSRISCAGLFPAGGGRL